MYIRTPQKVLMDCEVFRRRFWEIYQVVFGKPWQFWKSTRNAATIPFHFCVKKCVSSQSNCFAKSLWISVTSL